MSLLPELIEVYALHGHLYSVTTICQWTLRENGSKIKCMKPAPEISYGRQSTSNEDYRQDCQTLSPAERLACIQKLRIAFWGDEAATGRLQRSVVSLKRAQG